VHHPRGQVSSTQQHSLLVTVALVIAALAIVISLAGIVLAAVELAREQAGAAQDSGSHSVDVVISAR
jgi:hypothetical protein